MVDLFRALAGKATGMEYIETFLRYIVSAPDKIDEHDIKDILTKKITY